MVFRVSGWQSWQRFNVWSFRLFFWVSWWQIQISGLFGARNPPKTPVEVGGWAILSLGLWAGITFHSISSIDILRKVKTDFQDRSISRWVRTNYIWLLYDFMSNICPTKIRDTEPLSLVWTTHGFWVDMLYLDLSANSHREIDVCVNSELHWHEWVSTSPKRKVLVCFFVFS